MCIGSTMSMKTLFPGATQSMPSLEYASLERNPMASHSRSNVVIREFMKRGAPLTWPSFSEVHGLRWLNNRCHMRDPVLAPGGRPGEQFVRPFPTLIGEIARNLDTIQITKLLQFSTPDRRHGRNFNASYQAVQDQASHFPCGDECCCWAWPRRGCHQRRRLRYFGQLEAAF